MILFYFVCLININVILYLLYNSKLIKRHLAFKRFVELFAIYERTKASAFDKIWREELVVYIVNKRSITKSVLEEAVKKYVVLFYEIAGPDIVNDMILIHGDDTSFVSYIGDEFVNMTIEKENAFKPMIVKGQNNDSINLVE